MSAALNAERLLALGKYADAERYAREAVAADSDSYVGYDLLAAALTHQGRHAEAVAAARMAAGKSPGWAWPLVRIGWALTAAGRRNEAIEPLREAVRLDPLCEAAHAQLAHTFYTGGAFDAAVTAAEAGLAVAPDQPALHEMRAFALLALRRLPEAVAAADTGLRLDPSGDGLLRVRALACSARTESQDGYKWLDAGRVYADLRAAARTDPLAAADLERHALEWRHGLMLGLGAILAVAGFWAVVAWLTPPGRPIPDGVLYGMGVALLAYLLPLGTDAIYLIPLPLPTVPLTVRRRRIGRLVLAVAGVVWLGLAGAFAWAVATGAE